MKTITIEIPDSFGGDDVIVISAETVGYVMLRDYAEGAEQDAMKRAERLIHDVYPFCPDRSIRVTSSLLSADPVTEPQPAGTAAFRETFRDGLRCWYAPGPDAETLERYRNI